MFIDRIIQLVFARTQKSYPITLCKQGDMKYWLDSLHVRVGWPHRTRIMVDSSHCITKVQEGPVLGRRFCSSHWCCCCHSVAKWLFATLWTAAHQASLSSAISQHLLTFMSTESVMLSSRLILCHPLHLLPSIYPSMQERPTGSVARVSSWC